MRADRDDSPRSQRRWSCITTVTRAQTGLRSRGRQAMKQQGTAALLMVGWARIQNERIVHCIVQA